MLNIDSLIILYQLCVIYSIFSLLFYINDVLFIHIFFIILYQ